MNATAQQPALSKALVPEDNARRDELIIEYIPLVTAIAVHLQKSLPVHTELDDLIHAGTAGLFDAASKYRDDKEVSFPSYAKHRIRGAILDSLRQLDWASRELRKRYKQMETLNRDLSVKLGRTPTQNELAEAMGISSRRWQSLMVDFRSLGLAATQLRNAEREDQPLQEITSAPENQPDKQLEQVELREQLSRAMKTLPARYRQVVQLYYERDMTMKEIGGLLGVNESRVSQIHKSALERMQSALGTSGISSAAAL